MPDDFDDFKDRMFGAIDQIGTNLGPDDDWMPTLLYETADTVGVVPLVGCEGQEGLPAVTSLLVKANPDRIARVQMGWGAAFLPDSQVPASERPDRKELLTVFFCERGRDGRHELHVGEVSRAGGHPAVDEWTVAKASGGAIAEAMRMAMVTAGRMN